MAGTYSNSLQALNGIYGALEKIIQEIDKADSPEKTKEKNENTVKNLNKGGLSGALTQNNTPGQSSANVPTPTSIKDISSALLSLPPAIKAIAGLSDKSIRKVINLIDSLNYAFSDLSDNNNALKGAATFKALAQGLLALEEIKFFQLIIKLKMLESVDFEKTLGKTLTGLVKSYKSLNDLSKKDIENYMNFTNNISTLTKTVKEFSKVSALMPIFNLSVAMFIPAMNKLIKMANKMPDKSKMEAAIESTKLVTNLASSAAIIVATAIGMTIVIKQFDTKSILLGIGLTVGIVTLLGGLAIVIELCTRRSRGVRRNLREINRFINSLALTTGLIFGLAILYTMQSDSINKGILMVGGVFLGIAALAMTIGILSKFLHIRREMNAITRFMTGLMLLTGATLLLGKYAAEAKPLILQGLGIVLGVLTAIMGLALLTGIVMSFIRPVAMGAIMGFMGFSLLLVAGTLLIGAILANESARQMLLVGLAATAGIMVAYTALAVGAAFLGALVMEGAPFLGQVIKFAGFSMGLVLGTILIGAIITQGWDLLLIGLAGTLGTAVAYSLILKAVNAMGPKLPTGIAGLKDVAIFAAGCLVVAFATVALGLAMREAGWWTVAAIGLLGTIILSVEWVSQILMRMSKRTSIATATPQLKVIGAFLAGAELLAGGVVGLAYAIKGLIGGEDWKTGAASITAAFAVLAAVVEGAFLLSKQVTTTKPTVDQGVIDIKSTLLFMGGAELLAGGVIALAYAYRELGDNWKERLEYVGAVFGLITGIVTEGIIVAKQLATAKSSMEQGVIDIKSTLLFMGGAELLAGGIIGIAYALREIMGNSEDWLEGTSYIIGAFGLVTLIVTEGVILSNKISATKSTMDKGEKDIRSALIFMGAAELLAGGIIGLAKALEYVGEGMITGALALTTGILIGAVKLAEYATTHSRGLKQGAKDIKDAELIMGAAELLAGGVIGLGFALKELLGGQQMTVASVATGTAIIGGVFGLITAIITGAATLAKIASKKQTDIKKGAVALLLAEGVMAGAAGVLFAVIKVAEQGKGKWKDVTTALGEMAIILAATGAMAFAASKIKSSVVKGAVAMALCEALALGSALVLAAVIKVAVYGKEKLGDTWGKESATALGEMAAIIAGVGAMAFAAGALIVGPQAAWFLAGSAGIAACEALGYAGAKMLKAMIEVADLGGEEIHTKIGTTLEIIKDVVKQLGEVSAMGLREAIRIRRGAAALKQVTSISGTLIENIDSLIKLTTYMQTQGTSPDDLSATLGNILDVISPKMFVKFFDETNMKEQMKKVKNGYKSYKKVLDIVKTSLDVYSDFIVKTKGININEADLVGVSTAIVNSLEVFMNHLTDKSYNISKKTVKRMSLVLGSLIEPISNFAELVSKYSGDGKTLKVITYDEQGRAREGIAVNVSQTAETILTAVMTFCDVLYNENNEKIWKNITQGVDSKGKSQSTLQSGIGIFASIMDPVVSFAQVLTMFGYDAQQGMLTIPEYDKEGKLINNRAVDVKSIASIIAGAVTTFVEELYVNHEQSWVTILKSLNKIDPGIETTQATEEKTGNKAGLSEAIGVFGEILNPVLNFASVLLKFGTEKGMLTVFDENGKAKPVDVKAISENIAGGVTQFITSIAGIFTDPVVIDNIKLLSENSMTVLDVINGFVNDISTASQIDSTKLMLVTGSTTAFTATLGGLLNKLTKEYTTTDLGMFKATFKIISEVTNDFLDNSYPSKNLNTLLLNTNTLILVVQTLMKNLGNKEEMDNFKLVVTDFSEFMATVVDSLTSITSPEKIDISQLTTNNDTLAQQIKDSYMSFVSSISNFDNMDIISEKIETFKKFMTDGMKFLLSDFIGEEELNSFQERAALVRKSINASLQDMTALQISDGELKKYVAVTSSIKQGLENITGAGVDDVAITRTTAMYNSIVNSINTLINEEEITNVDKFNKNYDTLMKNLESASQDSKVKKINNLSNAVVKSSNSLKGFDNTLNDGNKKRIAELDNFGKAVGRITDKLRSSQNEINNLKDLMGKLERVNPSNLQEIAEQVSKMNTVHVTGGGGASINTTELAQKIAIAIATVLNNATIDLSPVQVKDDRGNVLQSLTGTANVDMDQSYVDESMMR